MTTAAELIVAIQESSETATSWGPDAIAILTVIVAASGILITMALNSRKDIKEAAKTARDTRETLGDRIDAVKDGLTEKISGVKDGLTEKISDVKDGLTGEINGVKNGLTGEIKNLRVEIGAFRGATVEQIEQLQNTTNTTSENMGTLSAKTAELTGAIRVITDFTTKKRKS